MEMINFRNNPEKTKQFNKLPMAERLSILQRDQPEVFQAVAHLGQQQEINRQENWKALSFMSDEVKAKGLASGKPVSAYDVFYAKVDAKLKKLAK